MPKASSNHRDVLLDAAQALILSKGFPATRVDEICAAAQVTKGSFYHHFESKDDLAAALIEHYFNRLTTTLCAGAWQAKEDPVERVAAFLDHTIKVLKGPLLRQGCLLGSFALDLSQTHPEIRTEIERRFDQLVEVLEPTLRTALKQQGVRGGASAGALARQFVSVLQGAIVLAKAYDDHDKLTEGMKCYRTMLRAVLQL